MDVIKAKTRHIVKWKTLTNTGACLLVLALITACSAVPDAMNPVEWYRDTVDIVMGNDEKTGQNDTSTENTDEEFPSLASVPVLSSVEGNNEVADSLIADPNKPEYAVAPTRQTEEDEMMPPPEPTIAVSDENLQPAPPAQPVTAVTSQEINVDPVPVSTPLIVEPGRLPSGETYEDYRARLMAGLEISGTTAGLSLVTTPSKISSSDVSDIETIVISSSGIDMTTPYTISSITGTALVNQSGFQQINMNDGSPLLTSGSVKVATIHFNNGSSRLDGNDLKVLQKVVALQQQSGGTVRIIGHASSRTRSMDPMRHKMVNYTVSAARADAVAKQLVRLGAAKMNILVGAASDAQPKYYEVMPTGEAGNRRAEIYIDS